MTKEIQLSNEDYNLAVAIIQKQKDTGRLSIQMNKKTYGGLITLNGNSEEIESLCSILLNNGVVMN